MSIYKKNFHKIATKFADDSTMHGLKDIKDASHITLKILWAFAICITVALLAFQTKFLLDAFADQKTASSSNTIFIDEKMKQMVVYCSDDWIDLQ